MLTVDNLSFYKNHKKIFSNLSFSIAPQSVLIVTGKNGVGKTTFLKILAGITKPTLGKLLWSDIDVEEIRDQFNGDLQFLGHKNFLKSELSVLENLRFYTKLHDSEILLPSALRFFNLEEIANQKIKTLSMGWQRRVMLAKLICCPATIWLLDEPTNNLDKAGKEKLKGLIETKVNEGGGLVIIVTHDEFLFDIGVKLNIEDFIS